VLGADLDADGELGRVHVDGQVERAHDRRATRRETSGDVG